MSKGGDTSADAGGWSISRDYAINRIAKITKFKRRSRMLCLSAASYCMKYEVRLPNLPVPPPKDYDEGCFVEKFMDLDLHRTTHSAHNSAILDISGGDYSADVGGNSDEDYGATIQHVRKSMTSV